MTITADSYESTAIQNAISMLAGSATFRALVGVATADEAKAFIVETHSGAPGQNSGKLGTGQAVTGASIDLAKPTYGIVGMDPGLDTQVGGVGYVDYEFSIGIRLVLPRVAADLSPAEVTRQAWNKTGLIRSEMQALVGGANALADAEIASAGLFMDEEGVHRDHIITQLTITARG